MTGDGLAGRLAALVGEANLLIGEAISDDYRHDEALGVAPVTPAYVVKPGTAQEVASVLKLANDSRVPVTARGSGSGLSGGAVPRADGVVVSFERMASIAEIDTVNHTATVQPGVTLAQLDEATAKVGLAYQVHPGELSGSLGGNVNTNAGGMSAIRYGVTRQHVLGLEVVLATGEILRTGGKVSKVSSGYDLTQLIVGSEGTLALVTEAVLRLAPRLEHQTTLLAPFSTLDEVTRAVPKIVASGIGPTILEYIDMLTMAAISHNANLSLGIPDSVRDTAQAYLVVSLENRDADRLETDIETAGEQLGELGAIDVYVLPGPAARKLIEAREKAFWTAKAAGADCIIDTVVPRGAIPDFVAQASKIATEHGSYVIGCGHAGDGNVHFALFQKDPEARDQTLKAMFAAGMALGGMISGEHGIGQEKKKYFLELEDPTKIALMRRIKSAFDPNGILNPDILLVSPEGNA
ncbi:FAD-binding oxidoreductase [Fodinicola feengrottensis]